MILDQHKRPHNPFTIPGALMACSMIKNTSPSEKFKLLLKTYKKCSGKIGNIFMHNSIYLSEK
jgi:glutaminase